jgi:hypothetical protein
VAEDQPIATGRRPAVHPIDDLSIRAVDADGDRLAEQPALGRPGFVDLGELGGSGAAGPERHGEHRHGCRSPEPQIWTSATLDPPFDGSTGPSGRTRAPLQELGTTGLWFRAGRPGGSSAVEDPVGSSA